MDNDPVVILHATALLTSPGRVAAVPGDARRPGDILTSPGLTAVIDTSKPFCVILATILDFFESAQAAGIVAAFRRAMPAESFLILCIGINNDPDLAQDWIKAYSAARVHLHSGEQIGGAFDVFGAGHTEVDPARVEVVEHFDVRAGEISRNAVLGQGCHPSLAGNGNGGDSPIQGFSEGDSNVV